MAAKVQMIISMFVTAKSQTTSSSSAILGRNLKSIDIGSITKESHQIILTFLAEAAVKKVRTAKSFTRRATSLAKAQN